jgi:hypothetical protein
VLEGTLRMSLVSHLGESNLIVLYQNKVKA